MRTLFRDGHIKIALASATILLVLNALPARAQGFAGGVILPGNSISLGGGGGVIDSYGDPGQSSPTPTPPFVSSPTPTPTPTPAAPATSSIVLTSWISMNGSAVIDSFDSSNPFKSTNGLYDPAKRQMHGDVSTNNSAGSDLHNAFVFGDLRYSGVAIKNCANVQGTISTPFVGTIPAVADPAWSAGSYVQYLGGGNPPASGMFIASGRSSNPALIKIVGDFTVPGGKTFSIVSTESGGGYLNVWVTGKFTTSGSGRLNQDSAAHVTWIVDKDISTSGDTYQNRSGNAANVSLVAIGSGKVNLTGTTSFIGAIEAPERALGITGAGGLSGGVIGNTLTLGGGSGIHLDEALSSPW